jgi:ubiquinone/menaquinone biosynthesis C-methylase UbiE
MTSSPTPAGPHANRHDEADQWREADFINAWVTKDDGRPNDRLEPMREALAATPYAKDAAIRALDVGAGYGMFASEVLKAFPNAVVTLQDVSEPMFDISRERLADQLAQLRFVRSDMSTSAWVDELDGPFDLAVSSIAIHNLYDDGHIARVYKEIHDVLKPGGTFINLDHIRRVGGVEGQTAWLRDAGFTEVQCLEVSSNISRLTARKAG